MFSHKWKVCYRVYMCDFEANSGLFQISCLCVNLEKAHKSWKSFRLSINLFNLNLKFFFIQFSVRLIFCHVKTTRLTRLLLLIGFYYSGMQTTCSSGYMLRELMPKLHIELFVRVRKSSVTNQFFCISTEWILFREFRMRDRFHRINPIQKVMYDFLVRLLHSIANWHILTNIPTYILI